MRPAQLTPENSYTAGDSERAERVSMRPAQLTPENLPEPLTEEGKERKVSMRPAQLTPENPTAYIPLREKANLGGIRATPEI